MESIETLNQRLIDHFGKDSDTNRPMFRIVWSDEQTEKRLVDMTEHGVQMLFPEVRELMKYPYIKHLYVLERLVVVPFENNDELLGKKLSYEPLWVYCDDNRNPIPPIWDATKFIIDTLYAALGKKSLAKYIDDEKNTTEEGRHQRIKELQLELFGNETETSDALRYKQGIVVPNSYGDQ
jgi:hypothetical protein